MAPSMITTIAHTGTTAPPELSATRAALVDVAAILLSLVDVGVEEWMDVGFAVACGDPRPPLPGVPVLDGLFLKLPRPGFPGGSSSARLHASRPEFQLPAPVPVPVPGSMPGWPPVTGGTADSSAPDERPILGSRKVGIAGGGWGVIVLYSLVRSLASLDRLAVSRSI